MCLAIDSPELVHSMVLGSTAAYADEDVKKGTKRWVQLARSGDMPALTAELVDSLYSEKTIGKYRDFLIHMNDNVSSEDIERFIIQTEAIDDFDVRDELSSIQCPTLVIGAEEDKVLPPEQSRTIAEKIGCELFMYGGEYGHCVFDEAPDYKKRILDFFRKSSL